MTEDLPEEYAERGLVDVRAEVEVRVGNLKNRKTESKDEVTGKMIKGGGERVVDWIWKLLRVVLCRKSGDLL